MEQLHLASYLSLKEGGLYKLLQLPNLSSSRHLMLKAQIAAAKSEYEAMVELDKDITPFVRAFEIKRKATATLM